VVQASTRVYKVLVVVLQQPTTGVYWLYRVEGGDDTVRLYIAYKYSDVSNDTLLFYYMRDDRRDAITVNLVRTAEVKI